MAAGQALAHVDVAVLAGGLGTRVRHVLGDVPKLLAPIAGRPFLDFLLDWLIGFGARRVVLCLGQSAGRVVEHLAARPDDGVEIVPVIEPSPLGTAGALRFAMPQLKSDPVFVLNGDTFVETDLDRLIANHRSASPLLSLLCAEVPSIARFGRVETKDGYVTRFVEKDLSADRPGLISGGMYLFSRAALEALGRTTGSSLERDFLQVQPAGAIRAETAWGRFIDIGTPESLADAGNWVPDMARGGARP